MGLRGQVGGVGRIDFVVCERCQVSLARLFACLCAGSCLGDESRTDFVVGQRCQVFLSRLLACLCAGSCSPECESEFVGACSPLLIDQFRRPLFLQSKCCMCASDYSLMLCRVAFLRASPERKSMYKK